MTLFSFTLQQLRDLQLKDFFKRFYVKAFTEEDLMSASAQVAFYFAFALFPLLLFLVSVFGIVMGSADDLRAEMFYYLQQVMPGSAFELVQKTVQEVSESSSGGKLTFGLLAALYAASAGIDSIRIVLNNVYNLTEKRAWWKTKGLSLLLTFILAVLVTVALGVIFYGGKFLNLILGWINLPVSSPFFLGVLQFVTVGVVLILIFALVYNYLPNHKKPNWVWITPGALVSIVLWLLLSFAFRLYLGYFNTYDKTYGSLGAVIILLLWLYLTALVILIGGSLNAALQEFTDPQTAAAGAKKSAAKAEADDPESNAGDAAKNRREAEVLEDLKQPSAKKAAGDGAAANDLAMAAREAKPPVKKSAFKLLAGVLIGFVESIRKR